MRHLLTIAFACFAASAAAQEPLYIVNGEVRCEVRSIPPDDIEHIEVFPAEEATIARFGTEAANGAIVLTLRYDRPARFPGSDSLSFAEYVAREVDWKESDPTARVVLRYTVDEQGARRSKRHPPGLRQRRREFPSAAKGSCACNSPPAAPCPANATS